MINQDPIKKEGVEREVLFGWFMGYNVPSPQDESHFQNSFTSVQNTSHQNTNKPKAGQLAAPDATQSTANAVRSKTVNNKHI